MMFLAGETGKKKTLYLKSDPNSAKSLFVDSLCDYLIQLGNMKTWNRNNSFPIEELGGCRIAIWNEPSYESTVEPELLKLLGGDKISISTKYKRSKAERQIPVICSSNFYKFPQTDAFNQRIRYDVWMTNFVANYIDSAEL